MIVFPAFAASVPENHCQDVLSLSNGEAILVKDMLANIPVFVTTMYTDLNKAEKEEIQENISEGIKSGYIVSDNDKLNKGSSEIGVYESTEEYTVAKLTGTQKDLIVENPLFARTLLSILQAYENGVKVNAINLYSHSSVEDMSEMTNRGYPNDSIEYWEENTEYLGSYGNYKFRYMETGVSVESNLVRITPNDLVQTTASFNWRTFLNNSITSAVSAVIDGVLQEFSLGTTIISNILNSFDTPTISLSYGQSEAYIANKVSGVWYIRDIVIKDVLDKIDGYAYYPAGCVQETRFAQILEGMAPIRQRASGLYDYEVFADAGPVVPKNTPGFYGTNTLFLAIIEKYNAWHAVYDTYDEEINVWEQVSSTIICK